MCQNKTKTQKLGGRELFKEMTFKMPTLSNTTNLTHLYHHVLRDRERERERGDEVQIIEMHGDSLIYWLEQIIIIVSLLLGSYTMPPQISEDKQNKLNLLKTLTETHYSGNDEVVRYIIDEINATRIKSNLK